MYTAFLFLTWTALFGVPVAGAVVLWSQRRHRPRAIVLAVCDGVLIMAVACSRTGWQTSSTPLNIFICSLASVCWCVVVFACWLALWTLKLRIVGSVAGAILSLALLPCAVVAPLVAIVFFGEATMTPLKVAEIGPGLTCLVQPWGEFAQNGYTVHLYRHWAIVPGLRREVSSASAFDSMRQGPTCESVARASRLEPSG